MSEQQKVVWAEGLFLGQQHFQLWDKGLRHDYQQRSRLLNPHCWGLVSLSLTREALSNGQCRVEAVTAVLPDGRLVRFDAGEQGQALTCELAGGGDQVDVWLALPANDRVGGINGYHEQGRLCGWQAAYRDIADEHDPSRSREVILAQPNLTLLRSDQSRDQYSTLCIGRFEHQGDGQYRALEPFIPPAVNLAASPMLRGWAVRIRDLLAARVRQLSQQRNSYGDLADMGAREMGQFLRLLQLRPALATLEHLLSQDGTHPETLYRESVRLLNGLCDFQADQSDLDLPEYRHSDLTAVFTTLETRLRDFLAEAAPTPSTALTLRDESPAVRIAEGVPWEALDRQHLYLGVSHDADDPSWVTDFARQTKSGSREDLELILASALPGIRLSHTQRPPNRLPVKSGFEYFRFEPTGEFWPRALEARSLAIFLPAAFQNARFNLLCVED
ncbi:type VI secretion system baseplate subunit TssK [Isoalcanivorax indicus]|uniref:type VI secretion system baseplate subunit TssK n=1 Tax=Isoalcanivorax indicus TaxID=2202653 RepID=UPI000DBA9A7A|nr:type VI secretion system baseplate subunit TssK [Isoalcanivorax indicus]